jgi:hypothetical protein
MYPFTVVALRQPHRKKRKQSAIIEDLLEMAKRGQVEAIRMIVLMLADLYQNPVQDCQFAQKLRGLPVWELKSHTRGGEKGGARVYFFVLNGQAVITGAEVKTGVALSNLKIDEALEFLVQLTEES